MEPIAASDWVSRVTERWLVTGGTGQVGTALRRNPPLGIQIFAPGRETLDLANLPDDLSPMLDGVSAIINCGAYTAVDKAESEPELAEAINAIAPGKLATAAAAAGIPIIHISTDYVFPVEGNGPWREDAVPNPGSVYGRSKLNGELAVRASGARHAIIRTAWVISADGSNFIKTILRAGAQNEVIRVVADQRGNPTHAGDLAKAVATIASCLTSGRQQFSGTWHFVNAGETTWHGLAIEAFASAAKYGISVPSEVRAISTSEYPTRARRPADSRLSTERLTTDFQVVTRPWQEALDEIIYNIAKGQQPV